jgi:hypothetical protein
MIINIDENIQKVNDQMKELHEELLRLEGSIRTLKSFRDMGIVAIPLKEENIVNSKEVTDGSIRG